MIIWPKRFYLFRLLKIKTQLNASTSARAYLEYLLKSKINIVPWILWSCFSTYAWQPSALANRTPFVLCFCRSCESFFIGAGISYISSYVMRLYDRFSIICSQLKSSLFHTIKNHSYLRNKRIISMWTRDKVGYGFTWSKSKIALLSTFADNDWMPQSGSISCYIWSHKQNKIVLNKTIEERSRSGKYGPLIICPLLVSLIFL